MAIEQVKIVKIGRKDMPSKFNEGDFYTKVTIKDEKDRVLSAFGDKSENDWTKDWKIGSVVSADIEVKQSKDRDGFDVTYYNMKNPNKKPSTWKSYKGGGNYINVQAYQIAAAIAPLIFKEAKNVKLEDIIKLANDIKKKISTQDNAVAASVPSVNLDKEEVKEEKKEVKKTKEVDFPDEDEEFSEDEEF